MSDNEDKQPKQPEPQKETAMTSISRQISQGLPPQKSDTDTSNWNDRISIDPNGEKNIRTDQSYKPKA